MEYSAAERKKELLHFPTAWEEVESITLCEVSQAGGKRKIPHDLPVSGT